MFILSLGGKRVAIGVALDHHVGEQVASACFCLHAEFDRHAVFVDKINRGSGDLEGIVTVTGARP